MLLITSDLRTDGGTQPRDRLNDAVVQRYAEEMEGGLWDFAKSSAPITAFHDGESYWLADGAHRVAAAKKARLDELQVDVRQGDQRDAILFSAGANATHGYPRSNEDKRRAVSRLLDDSEWLQWSDRDIARRCSVTHPFVSKLRASLETVTSERKYTTKHGTVATMDTSAIGKPPLPPRHPPEAEKEEWSLPENASGGVHALAKYREVPLPGAGATDVTAEPDVDAESVAVEPANDPQHESITTEPVELHVDPSLPGRRAADAATADRDPDGFCTYRTLKHYLDARRPSLPSQAAVKAMTPKQRATVRRLAEQSREWADGLLAKIEKADGAQ